MESCRGVANCGARKVVLRSAAERNFVELQPITIGSMRNHSWPTDSTGADLVSVSFPGIGNVDSPRLDLKSRETTVVVVPDADKDETAIQVNMHESPSLVSRLMQNSKAQVETLR